MKLIEHELVDRYIYYLQRYIPYDKQKDARDDFLEILKDRLPEIYREDDIKKELNRMGNPYEFASAYSEGGNFLISGKNYEIFVAFLKMLSVSALIGIILFIFNYFNRFVSANLFDLLKSLVISIFILSLLPSWICEKIKTKKILKALTEDWDIDNLYETKDFKIEKYEIALHLVTFSMYFMLQTYIITTSINISIVTYTFIMFLFFINVLSDNLKLSENTIVSKVMYLEYFVDIFTIISFIIMTNHFIPKVFIIKVIMLMSVINLILNTYNISKSKNILLSRKKRKKNKYKRRNKKDRENS
ncbi:MAG: hypothetical protein E6312_03220 [Peptoniphilus grossensis]|uniref:hypothetical protein n=1 Tax=Peptoniphilus grossensis TaxID=1465756 RepID=UPI0029113AEB|nr:hypothetical protein [Peptoniphilus grossensis]MDU7151066.1 hypothetical protein [Peptoniphilus grossensis]